MSDAGPMKRIGPYQVVRKLGHGGMGVVFEVQDPEMPRTLALKLILEREVDDVALERFWREAEAMGRVHHRGVVRIHRVGQLPQGTFIAMEKIEGQPLEDVCAGGPQAPVDAARIVRELSDAVEAIHAGNVLHRDIKPQNVILQADGIPVLLDFGLVRDLNAETLTRTGSSLGTLPYMSPEQMSGIATRNLGPATDVYSLGVVLFELLCGRLPFEGRGPSMVGQVLTETAPLPSSVARGVPRALDAISRKTLAKAPEDRYGSAAELRDDLDLFLRGKRPLAAGRRRGGWVALLVALLLVLGGVGWFLTQRTQDGPLSLEDAQARVAPLDQRARDLLAKPDVLLTADGEAIDALRAELEALEARAPAGVAKLDRTASRVRALVGLLALARGDSEAARALADALGQGTTLPAVNALAAALVVVENQGDVERAYRDLGRALARKVDRPEVRGWRARARVRAGLAGPAQAKEALDDLDLLAKASGGKLDAEALAARVRALLALDRTAEALAALKGISAPPALRWALALAQARKTIADPAQVLALLKPLPPEPSPSPERAELAKVVLRQAGRLAEQLRVGGLEPAAKARLVAACRLARRLVPNKPLPKHVVDDLRQYATRALSMGDLELGLILAELAPNDARVQEHVARLMTYFGEISERRRLLPVWRRAIEIAPDPKQRLDLQSDLCMHLADLKEHEECIALAAKVLPRLEKGEAHATVLAARAFALHLRGDHRAALTDIEEAMAMHPGTAATGTNLHYYRGRILLAVGKRKAEALRDLLKFLNGVGRIVWQYTDGMVRAWTLVRELDTGHKLLSSAMANITQVRKDLPGWWARGAWLELRQGKTESAGKLMAVAAVKMSRDKDERLKALAGDAARVAGLIQVGTGNAQPLLDQLVKRLEKMRGEGLRP